MNESSTLMIALRGLLLFLGAFGLPQFAGLMALRLAWKAKRKYLLIPAMVIAPVIFFATAYVYWGMQADAIRAEGHYVCGLFGAVAFFSTVWGTVLHFSLSAIILFFMWFVAKRRNRIKRGALL